MNPAIAVLLIVGVILGAYYLVGVLVDTPVELASNAISKWWAGKRRGSVTIVTTGDPRRVFEGLRESLELVCTDSDGSLSVTQAGRVASVVPVDGGLRSSAVDPEFGRIIAGMVLAAARRVDPAARLQR